MQPDQNFNIDHLVANKIAKKYAIQSRRSFLYRATKATFAILGVSIAGKVSLFFVPKAEAQPNWPTPNPVPWNWCGLDGAVCGYGQGTNCSGQSTSGLGAGNAWIQCCQNTQTDPCQLWYCCTYTDICQATPFNSSGC